MRIECLAMTLLLSVFSTLGAQDVLGYTLLEHTDVDGVKYVYQVEEEAIRAVPAWDSESDALSLSFDKAVSIATDWVGQKQRDKALELQSISLFRIQEKGIQDKWYYSIVIDAKYRDTKYSQASYLVVILLDGTVVEPEIYERQHPGS